MTLRRDTSEALAALVSSCHDGCVGSDRDQKSVAHRHLLGPRAVLRARDALGVITVVTLVAGCSGAVSVNGVEAGLLPLRVDGLSMIATANEVTTVIGFGEQTNAPPAPAQASTGVYGRGQLIVVAVNEQYTQERMRAELQASARKRDGANMRVIRFGYCQDIVVQNDPAVECITSRAGQSVTVRYVDVTDDHAMRVAEDLLPT